MRNETFVEENPAYAVLYWPDRNHGWSAKIVDLDGEVVTATLCKLTKAPEEYAVLYTPQPDGKWLAEIVDLPECKASRPEIALARIAVKDLARKALVDYAERGKPAPSPVTMCHYTRPTESPTVSGSEPTILEFVKGAVIKSVARHRLEHGTTPRSSSVCGYVTLSDDKRADDAALG